jgi:hypothetical protein
MTIRICSARRVQRAASLRPRPRGEPEARPFLCLSGLVFTIPGWRTGRQRLNQPMSGFSHFVDRPIEGHVVRTRGTIRAAQFPDELESGRTDLIVGGGRAEIGERLNISAHLKGSLAKLMILRSMIDDRIAGSMI